MTNANPVSAPALTDAQRALAAAIGEGFAEALQPLTLLLRGELTAQRIACEELVAAVDRLTAVIGAQAAGDIDPDDAPEIEMPLERFHSFDWSQISAQVLVEDEYGPAIVSYGGKAFKRRSPDNQFNPAIWFSRAVGKDEDGKNKYVRLITFKPMSDKVEPLGRKAEHAVAAAQPHPAPAAPAGAPTPQGAAVTAVTPPPAALPTPVITAVPAPAAQASTTPPVAGPSAAEQEFDSWPSASAGQPPLQPKSQQPTGPKVSQGANAANGAPAGRRQTTIGGGEVYAAFTKWAGEFAGRYPHYRIANTDRIDFYHIQVSLWTLGEDDDRKNSRFAYLRDLPTLQEAIAALEQHAKTHHGSNAHQAK